MNKEDISRQIASILKKRGEPGRTGSGLSGHMISSIENPHKSRRNYHVSKLLEYLQKRGMTLVIDCVPFGESVAVHSMQEVHQVIRRGMDFYCLSEGDIINSGIQYRLAPYPFHESIGIEMLCRLMDMFNFNLVIKE